MPVRSMRFPVLVIAALFICGGARAAGEQFEIVGWQLHQYDEEYINRVIDMAAGHGVNHLQLSHGIIMNIDDINDDPDRADLINRVASHAAEKGIKTYVWVHEFNTDRITACLGPGEKIWRDRQEAYRRALEKVPAVAGVILVFGSSSPEPWSMMCTCSWCAHHDAADRVALIIHKVGQVVAGEFGMEIFVRAFIHTPEELGWMGEALRKTQPRPGLYVMTKGVPQDWEPYYPHNSLIGNTGGHPQVIELDLAGEYWGKSAFPVDLTDYLRYRMLHARDAGAVGFVARVERGPNTIFDTPNEINLHAYHALIKDTGADPGRLRLEWIEQKYGLDRDSGAARKLSSIFRRTFDAARKMYYVLGFWALEKGSDLTLSATYPKLLSQRSIALYDPLFQPLYEKLEEPDAGVLNRIMVEKNEAVSIAKGLAAEADAVEGMKEDDREELVGQLERLAVAAEVWSLANGALWSYRVYEETGNPEAREWAMDFIAGLEGFYGDSGLPPSRIAEQWPGGPDRVDSFVENFRAVLPGAPETPENDFSVVSPHVDVAGMRYGVDAGTLGIEFDTTSEMSCRPNIGEHLMKIRPYGEMEKNYNISHDFSVRGLSPAERYIFTISCRDRDGMESETSDYWAYPAAGE